MLLEEFAEQIWRPRCMRLRECTRVGYESAWCCHIQPKWGRADMESLTANDIEEWLGSSNTAAEAVVYVDAWYAYA